MEKFELSNDMLTNITDIDDQHRKLLSWANALSSDDTKAAVKIVDEALSNLTRYVSYHFRAEEEAMERYGYQMLDKHEQQHERLMLEVGKLVIRSKNEGATRVLLFELQYQFTDWFLYHIKEWDQPFADFLKSDDTHDDFTFSEDAKEVDWKEFDWT